MSLNRYSSPAEIKAHSPKAGPVTSMLMFLHTFYPHEVNACGIDEAGLEKMVNALTTKSMETL